MAIKQGVIFVRPTGEGEFIPITPSSITWSETDVSDAQAGRTMDALMHKNQIAQKKKLQLKFNALRPDELSVILKAFDAEYLDVKYPDAKSGQMETRVFYTGDRQAEMYLWTINNKVYRSTSFNLIER